MPGPGEIVVGDAMAETVAIDVGDEVVLVAPAADGSTGNDLFTVSGIFSVGVGGFDDSYALLDMGSLRELMAMDAGRIHEMAGIGGAHPGRGRRGGARGRRRGSDFAGPANRVMVGLSAAAPFRDQHGPAR